ncbi:hypothetical protein FJP69_06405 [Stenotrophomonas maltophilia]|nr:hypothetical protein FJP69_06405 [Stenotrophomonas maltophilia]
MDAAAKLTGTYLQRPPRSPPARPIPASAFAFSATPPRGAQPLAGPRDKPAHVRNPVERRTMEALAARHAAPPAFRCKELPHGRPQVLLPPDRSHRPPRPAAGHGTGHLPA